jgi:hypothetical protein
MSAITTCHGQNLPRLGYDQNGGRVFEVAGAKYVFWRVDADT